jgi:hypothetical protein
LLGENEEKTEPLIWLPAQNAGLLSLALSRTAINLALPASPIYIMGRRTYTPPQRHILPVCWLPGLGISKCQTLSSAQPIDNARFIEIVRRHLDFDPVAYSEADESFPHLAGNVGKNEVMIFELNAEHGSG